MKTIIILAAIFGFAYAWPGGCDMSSVSNKEWKLAKPLDASKLVFADYGISTKPTFSRYLSRKIFNSRNFSQKTFNKIPLGKFIMFSCLIIRVDGVYNKMNFKIIRF